MPIFAAAPPVRVSAPGGFDYVAVDARRGRVYAADAGTHGLLVVNAETGKVVGTVRVGRMHGLAVNEANGNVYTGDHADAISEVDPTTMKEIRRVKVGGPVDAIAYDSGMHRIYADEDDGNRLFVVDSRTFKVVATVQLPGHKPEYLAVDPKTHDVYQNIANLSEIVVIDPHSLKIVRTIRTPELRNDHPLQYDPAFDELVVAGENRRLSVYDSAGRHRWTIGLAGWVDQCNLDPRDHMLACAGKNITLVKLAARSAPVVLAQRYVSPGFHSLAIDPKTGEIWGVWSAPNGSFIQHFAYRAK